MSSRNELKVMLTRRSQQCRSDPVGRNSVKLPSIHGRTFGTMEPEKGRLLAPEESQKKGQDTVRRVKNK
jgi:hypothetical protein